MRFQRNRGVADQVVPQNDDGRNEKKKLDYIGVFLNNINIKYINKIKYKNTNLIDLESLHFLLGFHLRGVFHIV